MKDLTKNEIKKIHGGVVKGCDANVDAWCDIKDKSVANGPVLARLCILGEFVGDDFAKQIEELNKKRGKYTVECFGFVTTEIFE